MPANPPYIPPKQALFDAWLANFSGLITANPSLYGLLSSDAVTIAGLYAAWHAAYVLVTSTATRTGSVVSAKNTAYATVVPQIRAYSQQIAGNAGVASADKIALGLNPKTSTPSPITPPTSNPVLVLQSVSTGSAILRYRDSAASPSVKSKPYGTVSAQLLGAGGIAAITNPLLLTSLLATMTKSPYVLNTSAFAAGTVISCAARWATRRALVSALSPILTFVSN